MKDASVYWLGATESEIHLIDSIVSAYDGLANVRREYRLNDGQMQYKVYVASGMEQEFLELVDRLRSIATISSLEKGTSDALSSPTETG